MWVLIYLASIQEYAAHTHRTRATLLCYLRLLLQHQLLPLVILSEHVLELRLVFQVLELLRRKVLKLWRQHRFQPLSCELLRREIQRGWDAAVVVHNMILEVSNKLSLKAHTSVGRDTTTGILTSLTNFNLENNIVPFSVILVPFRRIYLAGYFSGSLSFVL